MIQRGRAGTVYAPFLFAHRDDALPGQVSRREVDVAHLCQGIADSIVDGPFAETKEFLGGFVIIDVPNLDAALEWAARNPAAGDGVVEVRPLMDGTMLTRDMTEFLNPA